MPEPDRNSTTFAPTARRRDPGDRRRYALDLTELGRERLSVVRTLADRLNAEVLDALGADDLQELRTLLAKIIPDEVK